MVHQAKNTLEKWTKSK